MADFADVGLGLDQRGVRSVGLTGPLADFGAMAGPPEPAPGPPGRSAALRPLRAHRRRAPCLAHKAAATIAHMVDLEGQRRYSRMTYRRTGRSGLKLPAMSLGLWQNFGHDRPLEVQSAIVRRAFDLGITHFDLANNYGPPYGSAEENFGRILASDLAGHRDELVISTKAGYDMWPGPYGDWGSRKYLLASLDQSLKRMGLEYVDIFYSHRADPETPLEETMGALDTAVRQGKALYAGVSSYSADRTRDAAAILRRMGTPLLIHQPSYSMLNRWIEKGLLDVLGNEGVGCIVFPPPAQRPSGKHPAEFDRVELDLLATSAALVESTRRATQPQAEPLAVMFRPVAHHVRHQAPLVVGGHRHPLPGRPGDVDPMDK